MWPCSVLLSLLLVTLGISEGALSQAPTYGERGSDLGLRVFQLVARAQPQENVVLSPHGVASILGMLLPGADGETRRQIFTALRYKKNGSLLFILQDSGVKLRCPLKGFFGVLMPVRLVMHIDSKTNTC